MWCCGLNDWGFKYLGLAVRKRRHLNVLVPAPCYLKAWPLWQHTHYTEVEGGQAYLCPQLCMYWQGVLTCISTCQHQSVCLGLSPPHNPFLAVLFPSWPATKWINLLLCTSEPQASNASMCFPLTQHSEYLPLIWGCSESWSITF